MRRSRSIIAPLAVLVIGVVVSVLSGAHVRNTAERELDISLERGASEIGLVIQGLSLSFEAELASLAAIATVTGGDPATQERFAAEHELDGYVVVDATTDPARVITAVGDDATSPEQQRAAAEAVLADPRSADRIQDLVSRSSFGFVLGDEGSRTVALAAGATSSTGQRYAALRLFDVGDVGMFVVPALGGVDRFGVYVGDEPDPARAVLASTADLPLTGTTTQVTTEIGDEELLIQVAGAPAHSISPALVSGTGLVLTLALAGLLATALRRRNAAIAALAAAERAEGQRMEMENDLQQAQRMETIGQLAGGIAHDFNNLLAAISTTAELVLSDVDDPDTQQDIEAIIDATQRGAGLTKRLLAFSRRDLSRREQIDVDAVVAGMADLLVRTIGEHIDLDVTPGADGASVLGDPAEIEQVLLNLVVNARDAASEPGLHIEVRTEVVGDDVVLRVRDNGQGMTPDVAARAFEPFFSTKAPDRGTGLGLSIVYGIATRMGGSTSIESTPGAGTTVEVALPRIEAATAHPEPAVLDEARAEVLQEIVLLVEDEPAVRRAAQRLLERAGHVVFAAADGHEALDIVAEGPHPTVLVTDVVLPGGLTGHDVAERVRATVPGIRVVYASGYSREVLSTDQLDREHASFIAKPFTSRSLLGAVLGESTPAPAPQPEVTRS